ncbi:MAG: OmpA family protein [Saprospiraceae bacterium]|nr:OmpA family protein [Saprospiraceae bacterium]
MQTVEAKNCIIQNCHKRAQAAIDYLIAEGIDSRRLIAKGFGETQPVVACPCDQCTDAQHQTNRRTTFKVLK